jgi:hypothetical protein
MSPIVSPRITHHPFNGVGINCPGEFLGLALSPADHGNGGIFYSEIIISIQHAECFFYCLADVACAVWPSCQ